jgi:hypothetical protein
MGNPSTLRRVNRIRIEKGRGRMFDVMCARSRLRNSLITGCPSVSVPVRGMHRTCTLHELSPVVLTKHPAFHSTPIIALKREKRCGCIHDEPSLAEVQSRRSLAPAAWSCLEDFNLEYSMDT